ncbi:MAG: phosphoribosylanthranilate isomerase [Xanthomonadaceae bacterium]|jgi:phosphoribosylanthranilate isomerase|nr:phosphoribosylanthranilate isomerase [Xanthomonadaceae bacterium]
MTLRTRVKFCGITDPADLQLAGELGVDAVGFVFAHNSRRCLKVAQAQRLRQGVPVLVDVVALFQDNSEIEIQEVLQDVRPGVLQFHGNEDEAFCRSFRMPYLKAIPMGDGAAATADDLHRMWPSAAGLLFDSHASGGSGGTGKTFDWSHIPAGLQLPFLLAGGLTPDNVFDAIMAARPWGVDVSSGIESAPGIKQAEKMRRFVQEVQRADSALQSKP